MKNITDIKKSLEKIGLKSQNASKVLINLSTAQKNKALSSIANEIQKDSKNILNNNDKDINNAKIKNLSVPLIDRLMLNEQRIKDMVDGVRAIEKLSDPVGKEIKKLLQDKGHLEKVLKKGKEKANIIAEENLKNIREKVGLL